MTEPVEYEVKIPVNDLESVRKSLKNLGYELARRVEEIDHYVDLSPCVGVRTDEIAFRIRFVRNLINGEVFGEVTYKGPPLEEGVKARVEISSKVKDPESLVKAYTLMGFRLYRLRKVREVYSRSEERATLYLDEVEGLGKFIEVEVMNPESKESYLKELRRVKEKLGLSEKPELVTPYLTMLLEGLEK